MKPTLKQIDRLLDMKSPHAETLMRIRDSRSTRYANISKTSQQKRRRLARRRNAFLK